MDPKTNTLKITDFNPFVDSKDPDKTTNIKNLWENFLKKLKESNTTYNELIPTVQAQPSEIDLGIVKPRVKILLN